MLSTEICVIVFLKLAIPLNIFTGQLRKNNMGDGFYYYFFHVWLQPVSSEETHKSNKSQSFLSVFSSLIMGALKSTESFFITAEARSSRWVSDG